MVTRRSARKINTHGMNVTDPKQGIRTPRSVGGGERTRLLSRKISDMSLVTRGTRLEPLIEQLYRELEHSGLSFKPGTYLSDDWGCPNKVPVIGIPFYLVDPILCSLEGEMTGVEAENDAEITMYLRHEAGHAFNYAYRLYRTSTWRETFGRFSEPYREAYKPVPFSARYVRHVSAWYAQRHPDDDFAETFAVWLSPQSEWRETYAGTAALAKLDYVEAVVHKYGRRTPAVTATKLDTPVQGMKMTLDAWYATRRESHVVQVALPRTIDNDLRCLFLADNGQPAANLLLANRLVLVKDVNSWTGVDRHVITGLLSELTERVSVLGLKTEQSQNTYELVKVSVFVTTLVMNYLCDGQFIQL
jgi:hypothetical protein